ARLGSHRGEQAHQGLIQLAQLGQGAAAFLAAGDVAIRALDLVRAEAVGGVGGQVFQGPGMLGHVSRSLSWVAPAGWGGAPSDRHPCRSPWTRRPTSWRPWPLPAAGASPPAAASGRGATVHAASRWSGPSASEWSGNRRRPGSAALTAGDTP